MAEEVQYSSDGGFNKRKYEEETAPPSTRRPTGFSGPISSTSSDGGQAPPAYNSVPPPDANDVFESAKQKAREIASRLMLNGSLGAAGGAGATAAAGGYDAKRVRVDNGSSFDSSIRGGSPAMHSVPSAIPAYNFSQNSSKKIDIPSGRVGVIIGKAGDTIKYLQLQSGAKIQVTRDMDADPNASTRAVDIVGTPEQIARAEQLISDVLAEAEAGGSGIVSQRVTRQTGSEQFVMKVPNNKVGLVIGKGGETIKSMQATTGARIQVIPLRLPPGDTSTERNVHIDGTPEQVEAAKQLIMEVTSEERGLGLAGVISVITTTITNRMRNSMGGGGYQARPQQSWGAAPQMQQAAGYGYGAYSGAQQYMSQPQYGGYPPQAAANWDQTSQQGGSYDYYNQQQQVPSQQQQQQTPSSQGDPSGGYNYPNQQTQASSYPQQGYGQDGYGGYPAPQSGYTQQQPHYDQQQQGSYGSTTEGGHAASNYGAQGDSNQGPAPVSQPGYDYSQAGYGNPPTTQSGYSVGYGQSPSKPPTTNPPPPAAAAAAAAPAAYGQSQPPTSGYGAPSYGGPPPAAGSYGQQQPPAYGGYGGNGYSQPPPPAYSADGSGGGGAHAGAVPPASTQAPAAAAGAGGAPASPSKS